MHRPCCARGRLHLHGSLNVDVCLVSIESNLRNWLASFVSMQLLHQVHSTLLLHNYSILKREQSYNSDSVGFFINWHSFEPSFLIQGSLVLHVKC